MGPREAAYATQLLNIPRVIPMHYGTFPVLTGTVEEFQKLTASQDIEIYEMQIGETLD